MSKKQSGLFDFHQSR